MSFNVERSECAGGKPCMKNDIVELEGMQTLRLAMAGSAIAGSIFCAAKDRNRINVKKCAPYG